MILDVIKFSVYFFVLFFSGATYSQATFFSVYNGGHEYVESGWEIYNIDTELVDNSSYSFQIINLEEGLYTTYKVEWVLVKDNLEHILLRTDSDLSGETVPSYSIIPPLSVRYLKAYVFRENDVIGKNYLVDELHIFQISRKAGCGSAAQEYQYEDNAFSGQYCSVGETGTDPISFPSPGSNSNWTCYGVNGGSNASCQATRQSAPIDGECGSLAKIYEESASSYGVGDYCAEGTTSLPIKFPDAGQIEDWTCNSINNGNQATCFAKRKLNAKCGTANGHIFDYQESWQGYTLCEGENMTPFYPAWGEAEGSRVWTCSGKHDGSNASCAAEQSLPVAIDGECGSAAAIYAESASNFSGEFCRKGNESRNDIQFPAKGGTEIWECNGINEGASNSCTAKRQLNAKCGTADGNIFDYQESWQTYTLCEGESMSPLYPAWGETEGSRVWTCSGKHDGSNASCAAEQSLPVVIDGECGSAATNYAVSASNFSGDFCSKGNESPENILFPAKGQTVNWVCAGINGGASDSCSATRADDSSGGGSSGQTPNPDTVSNDNTQQTEEEKRADDVAGSEVSVSEEDPVNVAYGNYYFQKRLITSPAIGGALTFDILYDTLIASNKITLGYGWRHNWNINLTKLNDGRLALLLPDGDTRYFKEDVNMPREFVPTIANVQDKIFELVNGSYRLESVDKEIMFFSQISFDSGTSVYRITNWQNKSGRRLDFGYTASGIAQVSDNYSNHYIRFIYDSGNLVEVSAPGEQIFNFTYDSNDDLTSIKGPDGYQYSFTYSASHMMETVADAQPKVFVTNQYDSEGRVDLQWDGEGVTSDFEYAEGTDANGNATYTTTIKNRAGHTSSYIHDLNRRLIKQIDPLGNEKQYTWNADNQITSYIDQNLNVTLYEYNAENRLSRKITPSSESEQPPNNEEWTYYADGEVKTYTNQLGQTTTYNYDPFNRLIKQTNHRGESKSFEYIENQLVKVIDTRGKVTRFGYDDYGNRISVADPYGNTWKWTYDDKGNVLTKEDPLNHLTQWTYTGQGKIKTLTDPEGNVITWEYHNRGKVSAVIDQAGFRFELTYDSNDRITDILNIATGEKVTRTWTVQDQLKTETQPGGRTSTYDYYENGLLKSVTNALNQATIFEYDGTGNISAEIGPGGRRTEYGYDRLDNLQFVKNGENEFSYIDYDPLGRVTEQRNNSGVVLLGKSYDDENNKVIEKDALGNSTSLTYDSENNLIEKSDQNGKITLYDYDDNNRLTVTTDPQGGASTQVFDAAGRLEKIIDPIEGSTTFRRDGNGKVIEEHDAHGNVVFSQYDKRGLLTAITNARGQTTSFSYLANGKIDTETRDGITIQYGYNNSNDMVNKTDGNFTIEYSRDALGRLIARTDQFKRTIQWDYNTSGEVKSLVYSNGSEVNYLYDNAGRMISVHDVGNNKTTTYGYNINGLLSSEVKPDNSVTNYSYDPVLRLTGLSAIAGSQVLTNYNYTLDVMGKRTSAQILQPLAPVLPNIEATFDYDYPGSQQVEFNGVEQTFDVDGNNLKGSVRGNQFGFFYNSLNQLYSVSKTISPSDTTGPTIGISDFSTNQYDFDGYRVHQKTVLEFSIEGGSSNFEYVINPNAEYSQIIEEWNTDGNLVARYVWGKGLISRDDGDGTNYRVYHFDTRGSTVALTNSQANVTDQYSYGPFGELLASEGAIRNPFLYNGRDGIMTDDTGLYYMRLRFFNPESKRFINKDILMGSVLDGQTLNRYTYVTGDPVSFIDPLGMYQNADNFISENLDNLHLTADLAGLYPGIGIFADAFNLGLYIGDGDFGNAGVSALSMIPFGIGQTATIGKLTKNSKKVLYDDDINSGINKHIPGKNEQLDIWYDVNHPNPKSVFFDEPSAYDLTKEAVTKGMPNKRGQIEYDFGYPVGMSHDGYVQTIVRISKPDKNGKVHGFPAGPKKDPNNFDSFH